jgi:hypothetical protein
MEAASANFIGDRSRAIKIGKMSILADLFKKKIISGQWVAKFFFII